jgi:NitT/TauT family transport system substrate-binding protein
VQTGSTPTSGAAGVQPTTTVPVTTIKFGTLPIVDSLLFYVAAQEGYYAEEGLDVQIVTFNSARDMDVALTVGEIHGEIRDLIGVLLLNKDTQQVSIVQRTLKASERHPFMSIVVPPGSSLTAPEGLRGKKIAVGMNTIVEYVPDIMLEGAGVPVSAVQKMDVASIPARLTMLTEGQVDAAAFPEPAASIAVANGATRLLTDPDRGQGATVFRRDVLQKHPDAVRGFLRATIRAAKAINADPAKYQALLAQKANLPDILKDTFEMRVYPEGDIPEEQDIALAVQWMRQKGLLTRDVTYAETVDRSFLPG